MRRFRVYTTWGSVVGVQVDKTLVQLVEQTKRNGYICTPYVYVMFGAIAGIEDEEMVQAVEEASEREEWQ